MSAEPIVAVPPSRRREVAVQKSFRVRPSLWEEARDIAAERGERITDVLVVALEDYVKEDARYKASLAAAKVTEKAARRKAPAS